MREDEMEALLKMDGAGMEVVRLYAGFEARIQHPKDGVGDAVMFTGFSPHRHEAIAGAWQKYQQFMSTESGRAMLTDSNNQMMFRI